MKFLSRRLWKAAITRWANANSGKVYPARSEGAVSTGCVRGVARNSRTLAQLGNNCVGGQPLARVDNWFPLIPLSRLPLERHPRMLIGATCIPHLFASFYFQTIGRPERQRKKMFVWLITLIVMLFVSPLWFSISLGKILLVIFYNNARN